MNTKKHSSLKWDIKQRLKLLEATAIWTGEMSSLILIQAFGISRAQATKDIALYQEICPKNLHYDASQKRYLTTDTFKPEFIEGTADEFFSLLKTTKQWDWDKDIISTELPLPSVQLVKPFTPSVNLSTLQKISRAIRLKENIGFLYHTMHKDKEPYTCVLSPNSLVYNGFRWHIRGFSHNNDHNNFRDFVLSRIHNPTNLSNNLEYVDNKKDEFWNTWIDISLSPSTKLTTAQQRIVAEDYGMSDDSITVSTRGALVQYFLISMGLDLKVNTDRIFNHSGLLQVNNKKELEPYLWPDKK